LGANRDEPSVTLVALCAEEYMQWVPTPVDSRTLSRRSSLFDSEAAEVEEAREVAVAQLNLAFETLATVALRRIPTDADTFKSLMQACGRCGNTERAVQLIEMMRRDGFAADSETYSLFMKSFANDNWLDGVEGISRRGSNAYASYLKKKWIESEARSEVSRISVGARSSVASDEDDMDSEYSIDSEHSSNGFMADFYNAVFSPAGSTKKIRRKRRTRRRRKRASAKLGMIVTDTVLKQVLLGESLLDYLYPDLVIDTMGDACPRCSFVLSEDDVVAGWVPCQFQDFTTCCPQCRHRFVPKFTVESSSPSFEGSQGKSTPLYCEFLSPWVLRKELEHIIHGSDGIQGMLDPQWRSGKDIRATLWWNLIVAFNRYRLPVSFLLQGSFQNRLINPTPDSE
jgi:pentatricopeptide repeat protein